MYILCATTIKLTSKFILNQTIINLTMPFIILTQANTNGNRLIIIATKLRRKKSMTTKTTIMNISISTWIKRKSSEEVIISTMLFVFPLSRKSIELKNMFDCFRFGF